MSEQQSHLLADPALEARVAELVATSAHECALCYFAAREALETPRGRMWPTRMRWLADVQKPCRGCTKPTFHCSGGPWVPGKKATKPVAE